LRRNERPKRLARMKRKDGEPESLDFMMNFSLVEIMTTGLFAHC
jgi:hypothetical protein